MKKQMIPTIIIIVGLLTCKLAYGAQEDLDSWIRSGTLLALDGSSAPEKGPKQPGSGCHEPPPQAYEDCKGKKAGDQVQHTTPEGKVAVTCVDSPKGLVARPNQPPPNRSGNRTPSDTNPR